MLNKVTLLGNIGKDPRFGINELSKKEVASFYFATNDKYKDKSTGEQKVITDWHKIVIYNEKLVQFCKIHVKRGAKLYIEGQIKTRKYKENPVTEIILSDFNSKLLLLERGINETVQSFHEPKELEESKFNDDLGDENIQF